MAKLINLSLTHYSMSIVFLYTQGEAGEIAREEGVDFANADALRLDFKNILKIDNLWMFQRWAMKTSQIHNREDHKLRLWQAIVIAWVKVSTKP